jgi:hypothetical protein
MFVGFRANEYLLHREKSVYECTFRFDMHYKKTKRGSSLFDEPRLFLISWLDKWVLLLVVAPFFNRKR